MSSELILGLVGTVTGIIGTITGLTTLILKRIQEKPRIKISDSMVSLQKKGDALTAEVSFNVANTGDRATTIVRLNVSLGPDVEVIEALTNLSAHSSIRIPEKCDSSIEFSFPSTVKFLNGTQNQYFEKQEKLTIALFHTHGQVKKSYNLPASSQWEKQACFKDGPTVLLLG